MYIDRYQGDTNTKGEKFGFVGGDEEDAGYFFTWRSTLQATLDSMERDETVPYFASTIDWTRAAELVEFAWEDENEKDAWDSLVPKDL
jgi:hypothetical protein